MRSQFWLAHRRRLAPLPSAPLDYCVTPFPHFRCTGKNVPLRLGGERGMGDYYGPPPQRPRSGLGLPEWVVIALVASIILPIAFCTGFVRINSGGSTAALSSSSTSFSPTSAPAPTATPKPATIQTATLGSLQSAFQAAFGDPEMHGPVAFYLLTAPDGSTFSVCFCSTSTGVDGAQHLDGTNLDAAPYRPLTGQQMLPYSQLLMPRDSIHVRDFTDPDVGLIRVYHSDTLAATFPASAFTKSGPDAGDVGPGTFSVSCEEPDRLGHCSFVLGT